MPNERNDTRQHILSCGQRLVAQKGFVKVGLAEILSTANVPKGSFYYYFASKEAFGEALLDHYFAQYMDRLDVLSARGELSGAQRLLEYFERWIETQQGDDAAEYCLIVKLAAEIADLSEAMRRSMLAGTQRILRRLTEYVLAGQSDGSIGATGEPAELALSLYEGWLGASLLAKLRGDTGAFDSIMKRSRAMLTPK